MGDKDQDLQTPIERIVFQDRDKAMADFDQANRCCLDQTVCELGKLHALFVMYLIYGAKGGMDRFDSLALFVRSFHTLISALHLARQRAALEAFILLRGALETGCSGFHIFLDSQAHTEYRKRNLGEYWSTKAHIPVIGELWGSLSKAAVHVNEIAHGPNYSVDNGENTAQLSIDAMKTYPGADANSLTLICLVANIILRLAEMILLEDDPQEEKARRIPGSNMVYFSGTGRAIEEFWDRFLQRA